MNVEVRDATLDDATAIADLFYHTVLNVNIRDYSGDQVRAWAGPAPQPERWETLISAEVGVRRTFVAVRDRQVIGIADLEADGHIDHLFVHHEFQGLGVASRLLDRVEAEAQRLEHSRLYTEASITAEPFFRRKGFSIVALQQVEVRGQSFRNYRMEKGL